MAKKNTLTETRMREIIAESVNQMLEAREKHLLTGTALPRRVYKQKIDGELPKILTGWCLVRYCTVTRRVVSKDRWKEELRRYIESSAGYHIRGDDAPGRRREVFDEVWEENDFSVPDTINLTVFNRFYEEGIDTESEGYATTLIDCMNAAQGVFEAMLSRNRDEIAMYVETV